MTTKLTADRLVDLLTQIVVEWGPTDGYAPDDEVTVLLPGPVLRTSRRRFRAVPDGRLRRMVVGVPVFASPTCWNVDGPHGCDECEDCVGERADEVVFGIPDGGDGIEVTTQFAPVEYSDEQARTYTTLRAHGLSITVARAMTGAVHS